MINDNASSPLVHLNGDVLVSISTDAPVLGRKLILRHVKACQVQTKNRVDK